MESQQESTLLAQRQQNQKRQFVSGRMWRIQNPHVLDDNTKWHSCLENRLVAPHKIKT